MPLINYSTGATSIEAAVRTGAPDSIMGERPNIWLYIHGPGHERALKASRYASRRLTTAEKFATFDAALRNDFINYPQDKLTKAGKMQYMPTMVGVDGLDILPTNCSAPSSKVRVKLPTRS